MSFYSICKSDPVLDFIRDTYDATPLKIPDTRINPLTLLTNEKRRVRYLGHIKDVAGKAWKELRPVSQKLPDISEVESRKLSWSIAIDLLNPFLAQSLIPTLTDTMTSLKAFRSTSVCVSINGVRRHFISPIRVAKLLESDPIDLRTINSSGPFYLVDSILVARKITLNMNCPSAVEVATKLENALSGKFSTDAILRSQSCVSIAGNKFVPFAFTCFQLQIDESGLASRIEFPSSGGPQIGVAPMGVDLPPTHVMFGEPNEFVKIES